MEWIMETPASFKASVFQGISESDGWVDPGADTVCIVSSPNTELFTLILNSLGFNSRVDQQKRVQIIRVPTEDAMKIPIFSPRVNSIYYEQMRVMSHATRFPERKRLPDEFISRIRELSSQYETLAEICLNLATRYGVKVSGQTVKKYIR